jgi:hypothetical protein
VLVSLSVNCPASRCTVSSEAIIGSPDSSLTMIVTPLCSGRTNTPVIWPSSNTPLSSNGFSPLTPLSRAQIRYIARSSPEFRSTKINGPAPVPYARDGIEPGWYRVGTPAMTIEDAPARR